MDEHTGEVNMANKWKDHYSSLLNSVNNSMYRQRVESALAQVAFDKHMYVTAQNVKDAIHNLEAGKASDPDGLSAEALMQIRNSVYYYQCVLEPGLYMGNYLSHLWKLLWSLLWKINVEM